MNLMYGTLRDAKRPTTLKEYASRVADWNNVARTAKGGKATPQDLQWSFVREEFEELLDALRKRDFVEVVDAAMDLFVVASYAGLLSDLATSKWHFAMDYDPEEEFSLVGLEQHVYSCLEGTPKMTHVHGAIKQITALIFSLDSKIDYNMTEVLSSNDSKYPEILMLQIYHGPNKPLEEILEKECRDIEARSNGRYTGVYSVQVEDRVVFFDGNGKIMKPVTFKEPKIIP